MYEELNNKIGHNNFKMTCDYRLESLLKRSFPYLNFIPTKRTRWLTPEYNLDLYNSDLTQIYN